MTFLKHTRGTSRAELASVRSSVKRLMPSWPELLTTHYCFRGSMARLAAQSCRDFAVPSIFGTQMPRLLSWPFTDANINRDGRSVRRAIEARGHAV
jgi:hypothetical protein